MVDVEKLEFVAFSSVIVEFPVSVCAEMQERVSRKQASVTKMVSIAFESCSEVQHGQKDIEIKTTLLKHAPSHPGIKSWYSLQRKSRDSPCFGWMSENRDSGHFLVTAHRMSSQCEPERAKGLSCWHIGR